jgi:hypothetical protein
LVIGWPAGSSNGLHDTKERIMKAILRTIVCGVPLVTMLASGAHAQTPGMNRHEAIAAGGAAKHGCRSSDPKMRAECRQEKRAERHAAKRAAKNAGAQQAAPPATAP